MIVEPAIPQICLKYRDRRNLLTQINIDFKRNRIIDKSPQQDSKKDLGQQMSLKNLDFTSFLLSSSRYLDIG